MLVRIEESKDGSHTLFSNEFNQFYHNPNGAVAESLHIFFEQSGLIQKLKSNTDVNILEVGFGTGLNSLLLCDLMCQIGSKSQIKFHSIEAWPINPDTASKLNYSQFLNHCNQFDKIINVFQELRRGSVYANLNEQVELYVFKGLFADYSPNNVTFDFVFHDAFSPQVNPELWTSDVFRNILEWCNEGTILTTYCAASNAKKAMKEAGWTVYKAPGALGKREMTRAVLE
jgi:tRNA U34 5-methylaminomethyl-2-thiouridine-forming methyltransferase MnmC